MALDPLELAVIVGAIAIFLIWGPSKIPELARSLGRARGEYAKASKETELEQSKAKTKEKDESPDNELTLVAQALGISTEGKTKSQLAKEIIDKKSNQ
ncbi:MAG: twin-arginine translocase TatA/TatE family subunit [Candidatus Bathyarchaeia archaeon]|jgi:sec-independent protein translocase protein TatA